MKRERERVPEIGECMYRLDLIVEDQEEDKTGWSRRAITRHNQCCWSPTK
jgi:hypothetical protein